MNWKKMAVIVMPMIALALGLPGAVLSADLVVNGDFESYSGTTPKDYFTNDQPTGWSGGGGLTFIDAPGTADDGSYLSVYSPFPTNSPTGGNFVEADGDPNFRGSFGQTIDGLTPGMTYAVSFSQAAGQQVGFSGATFNQWEVSLGSETLFSSVMNLPGPNGQPVNPQPGDVFPWEAQTLYFVADAASDVLTFLANGGPNTMSLPPIAFLDGVSMTAVPEPSAVTMWVMGVGLLGLGAARMRQRARSAAV